MRSFYAILDQLFRESEYILDKIYSVWAAGRRYKGVFGRIYRETNALKQNEILEHNSSKMKKHKNKQNINREVNGNVNAAQTKNGGQNLVESFGRIKYAMRNQKHKDEEDHDVKLFDEIKIATEKLSRLTEKKQIEDQEAANWKHWHGLSREERAEVICAKWESIAREPWFLRLSSHVSYLLFMCEHPDYVYNKTKVTETLSWIAMKPSERSEYRESRDLTKEGWFTDLWDYNEEMEYQFDQAKNDEFIYGTQSSWGPVEPRKLKDWEWVEWSG